MSHSRHWYLLPFLVAGLAFLAGTTPATAAAPAAPMAAPGQALALLVHAFPALEAAGTWLGILPPRTPLSEDAQGSGAVVVTDRNDEVDPDHLPAPDETPSRDGGFGPWGDEASGPWPRS